MAWRCGTAGGRGPSPPTGSRWRVGGSRTASTRSSTNPGPARLAERFATHLAVEFPWVFTFLLDPAIHATNWRAEQALRPAVVTRKVWGGNRTARGAQTQQVLASLLRTMQQRELDAAALLTDILRAPEPIVPLALTGVQR